MKKYLIKIDNIPNKIRKKILYHMYNKLYLVGYKRITKKQKVFIIQLSNETRIWLLKSEIILK
uniref:Cytochrome b6-f complex subunit PetP n=1 Tax=Lophocladia kuetzingii TaxID=675577 RepID=A0A1Z1MNI8_9FLOR|nr:cytochrome b6-f complex subunit PetP [Lophocladia kuetzingii]ARW67667.1 cytochrome b6-f complex subunit PetP [Lophocladia kuetzingii]